MTEEKDLDTNVDETISDINQEERASEAPVDEEIIEVDEQSERVKALEDELNQSEEKYLRLLAEFENYKKRTRTELEVERTYRSQSVLQDLIPTLDNIERALQQQGDDPSFKALHKGVEMVHESMLHGLKSHGLEVIEAEGQQFDPNYHQAVMQESDSEKESGIVLAELQKGYKLKERVLRPSMVKVNE